MRTIRLKRNWRSEYLCSGDESKRGRRRLHASLVASLIIVIGLDQKRSLPLLRAAPSISLSDRVRTSLKLNFPRPAKKPTLSNRCVRRLSVRINFCAHITI